MEVVMALVSILAIVAIVLVAGGLIAFIGHMVIGAFDVNKSTVRTEGKNNSLDYTQFKEKEAANEVAYNAEYDFEEINKSKAEKEKSMLEKESLDIYALDDEDDGELEEIEKRLRQTSTIKQEEKTIEKPVQESIKEEKIEVKSAEVDDKDETIVEEDDDFDLDDLLSEISDEVIEEEKAEAKEEIKIGDELNSYNIDDMLRKAEEELNKIGEDFDAFDDEFEEDVEEEQPKVSQAVVKQEVKKEEITEVKAPVEKQETKVAVAQKQEELEDDFDDELLDIDDFEDEEDIEEIEEVKPVQKAEVKTEQITSKAEEKPALQEKNNTMALTKAVSKEALQDAMRQNTQQQIMIHEEIGNVLQKIETVTEKKNSGTLLINDVHPEVQRLKDELADLKRQLEIARATRVEIIAFDMTEEECMQKIEVLEERLKNAKKDYKINMKEYRPLKKVMNDLERYQTKLRRKEAVVAKKKVALYGVNNYVDIDKEKAEKLANEIELLDGLRLSVNHCENVINANKDRFPILEHSNQILESQIAQLESDLEQAQRTLKKIRERNGSDGESGQGQIGE